MFYVCYMRNETTVLDLVGDEVCGTNETLTLYFQLM